MFGRCYRMIGRLVPIAGLLGALAAGIAAPSAHAEAPLASIDGTQFTGADAAQRQRISEAVERRRLSPREALDELINDRLKVLEAGRLGFRMTDAIVDDAYARAARGNGGVIAFGQKLRKAGISENAFKAKLRADMAWEVVMRSASRTTGRLSNAEITAALNQKAAEGATRVTDYDLQSVVFIVPGGGGSGAPQMAKARAARKQFSGCKTGFDALRGTVDVAVKPPFGRSSTDLSEQTVKMLNATPIDQLTEPFGSPEGIEMIAVCGKRERQDFAAARDKIEQEANGKALQARSATLLQELRAKADIKYR